MKKIKLILILLIFSLFIFPNKAKALGEGETKKLYMNFNIEEDGSLKVYEVAKLNPNYNGRIRTLAYKNVNTKHFTGIKSDFEGSDIYNADSIIDEKIGSIKSDNINPKDLSNLKNIKFFQQTYIDKTGESGFYNENITQDGVYLKIYNNSTTAEDFYLEYTYKNAAVVHNDVAEVSWNILSNNYNDAIEELIVYVNLPKEDKSMRVWLRGPLHGTVERINDKQAKITYHGLNANNAVSFRMMFDKSLIPYSIKHSYINGKENILEVEQKAADIANAQREKAKLKELIIKLSIIIWYVIFIIVMFLLYKKKKELEQSDFNIDYLREFPADYGPEIVEYLISKKITDKAMSASILNLINKKALTVEQIPDDKKNYKFIKVENAKDLTESEEKLISMLIDNIGNEKEVTLKEIKEYGNTYSKGKDFLKLYDDWKNTIIKEAEKEDFFIKPPFIVSIAILICLLGIFITIIYMFSLTFFILGYLCIIIAVIGLIYIGKLIFRSKKGVLHYKKWLALKKFMEDFGTMDEKELPEIIVWEKYLVYATVLGCADKLEKDMKTRFDQMNLTEENYPEFYAYGYYNRLYLYSTLNSGIRNSIHSTYYHSVASTTSSSGSGFGGGASMGGGSFGGGGGGGHF